MAILGPLGFRSNEWRLVNGRFTLTSPSRSDFVWKEPLVWATCKKGCPVDTDGHVMPRYQCSCGIYATLTPAVVEAYIYSSNSVVMLVEAMDSDLPRGENIWLHDRYSGDRWQAGFTAPGALVVYVINTEHNGGSFNLLQDTHIMNNHSLAIAAVAQQFHTQVISYEDALGLCRIQWEKYGMKWGGA